MAYNSLWATVYLICPEILFINRKELCALPVCPGFPDIQQPCWNSSFAAVAEHWQVWDTSPLCCIHADVPVYSWSELCCTRADGLHRTIYSVSKRKFPNALRTWTSDSFLILIKAGECECAKPLPAYEYYFLIDTVEGGLVYLNNSGVLKKCLVYPGKKEKLFWGGKGLRGIICTIWSVCCTSYYTEAQTRHLIS